MWSSTIIAVTRWDYFAFLRQVAPNCYWFVVQHAADLAAKCTVKCAAIWNRLKTLSVPFNMFSCNYWRIDGLVCRWCQHQHWFRYSTIQGLIELNASLSKVKYDAVCIHRGIFSGELHFLSIIRMTNYELSTTEAILIRIGWRYWERMRINLEELEYFGNVAKLWKKQYES